MVKGVSRQVIVVRPPERRLFEQAIFILREDVPREGITDEMLLREARLAVAHRTGRAVSAPAWAFLGALATAAVWILTAVF